MFELSMEGKTNKDREKDSWYLFWMIVLRWRRVKWKWRPLSRVMPFLLTPCSFIGQRSLEKKMTRQLEHLLLSCCDDIRSSHVICLSDPPVTHTWAHFVTDQSQDQKAVVYVRCRKFFPEYLIYINKWVSAHHLSEGAEHMGTNGALRKRSVQLWWCISDHSSSLWGGFHLWHPHWREGEGIRRAHKGGCMKV